MTEESGGISESEWSKGLTEKILADNIKTSRERAGALGSPSFLNDEQWRDVFGHVTTKGPLPDAEKITFMMRHDTLARRHFLDLVFECTILYRTIVVLADRLDKAGKS